MRREVISLRIRIGDEGWKQGRFRFRFKAIGKENCQTCVMD